MASDAAALLKTSQLKQSTLHRVSAHYVSRHRSTPLTAMHEQAFGLPMHTRLLLRCQSSSHLWLVSTRSITTVSNSAECEGSGTRPDTQRISFTLSFSCLVVRSVCIDMAARRFQCTWVSGQAGAYQCVCTHAYMCMYGDCRYVIMLCYVVKNHWLSLVPLSKRGRISAHRPHTAIFLMIYLFTGSSYILQYMMHFAAPTSILLSLSRASSLRWSWLLCVRWGRSPPSPTSAPVTLCLSCQPLLPPLLLSLLWPQPSHGWLSPRTGNNLSPCSMCVGVRPQECVCVTAEPPHARLWCVTMHQSCIRAGFCRNEAI